MMQSEKTCGVTMARMMMMQQEKKFLREQNSTVKEREEEPVEVDIFKPTSET